MTRRIAVVTAGLSTPSSTRLLADRLAAAVQAQVSARGEAAEVQVVEVRELAGDLARLMTTGMATPALDAARETVSAADGLIVVTPVFAASYSGLFKMFLDALSTDALDAMPTIAAATAGTPRHSMVLDHAMRPLLTHLRAVVVPTGVFAATEDFGREAGADLAPRIRRAASELAALVVAESGSVAGFAAREQDRPSPRSSGVTLARVTPFEQLLAGHAGQG
ncbi:CE1759 family FMN reductase [Arsenicicoccus dermatophilus]|uniref:CE1759 family FMN reductase n=1 Tax=Arsenicicoccus dermatophilus TaxID=1076331 RepID=UPI001F4CAC5F|nr:CE1759 family FMN reductase [Arsenicicoccus dermatophilus]MCH8612773.1 NAD(P)H-dependent oxidoreductase [Arsenicicoccus dermatophilus]